MKQQLKDLGFSRQHTFKRQIIHAQQLKRKQRSLNTLNSTLLQTKQPGCIQPEYEHEMPHTITQMEIKRQVPIQSASFSFKLDLNWGHYSLDYTRTGSHLLLAGSKGHFSILNWRDKDILLQRNLEEKIRDAVFLQNETLVGLAQKKNVFIYDRDGVMLHRLQQTIEPEYLQYLNYHYLLVVLSRLGFMTYQDITTGQAVAHYKLKGSQFRAMSQNLFTGVIGIGDGGGRVHLHTPNSSEPIVKLLAHAGAISSLAMKENYLVTSGNEGLIKLYDIRTFKELHKWTRRPAAKHITFSGNNLLAMSCGDTLEIWKDFTLLERMTKPYLKHSIQKTVKQLKFIPFEDVLGIGQDSGFESIIVPGSAQANFDSFQSNPFETKKQRQQAQIHRLLDKLAPSTITLSTQLPGLIDRTSKEVLDEERREEQAVKRKYELAKMQQGQRKQVVQQEKNISFSREYAARLVHKKELKRRAKSEREELEELEKIQGLDIEKVVKRK